MSLCTTIQGKGFTFVATDTSVSDKINGNRVRTGQGAKFFKISDNVGVFLSGNILDCYTTLDYIKKCHSVNKLNSISLENGLMELKLKNKIASHMCLVIADKDKILVMDSLDDFKPQINNNPTSNTKIDIQTFSMKNEECKDYVLEYVNQYKNLDENVIIQALSYAYNKVSCEEVGGHLDIHKIINNTMVGTRYKLNDYDYCNNFKDYNKLLQDYLKTKHFMIGNGVARIDKDGSAYFSKCTLDGGNLEGGTITGTLIEGTTINGATFNGGKINVNTDITVGNNIFLQDNDTGITGIYMSKDSNTGLLFNNNRLSLVGDGVGLSSRGSIHLNGADIHLDANNVMMGNDHVATKEWVMEQKTVAVFG